MVNPRFKTPAVRLALRRPRDRWAFTLAEIVIALGVLGIGLSMAAALFPLGLRESDESIRRTIGSILTENGMAMSQVILRRPANLTNPACIMATDGSTNLVPGQLPGIAHNDSTSPWSTWWKTPNGPIMPLLSECSPQPPWSKLLPSISQYGWTHATDNDPAAADANMRYGWITMGRCLDPNINTYQLLTIAFERKTGSYGAGGTASAYSNVVVTSFWTPVGGTAITYLRNTGSTYLWQANTGPTWTPGSLIIDANTGSYATIYSFVNNQMALDRDSGLPGGGTTQFHAFTLAEIDSSNNGHLLPPLAVRIATVVLDDPNTI